MPDEPKRPEAPEEFRSVKDREARGWTRDRVEGEARDRDEAEARTAKRNKSRVNLKARARADTNYPPSIRKGIEANRKFYGIDDASLRRKYRGAKQRSNGKSR